MQHEVLKLTCSGHKPQHHWLLHFMSMQASDFSLGGRQKFTGSDGYITLPSASRQIALRMLRYHGCRSA